MRREIPPALPPADVMIGFYPEAATYRPEEVPPIAVHRVRGGCLDDGAIMLECRVIGLCDDEPEGKNLAAYLEDRKASLPGPAGEGARR